MDYKKYSLEQLEKWIHDAISSSGATPQEIYDVIKNAVDENYHIYKNETQKCYELLALLNGNGKGHIPAYDEYLVKEDKILSCDKDNPSPECQNAWNSFWEEHYYPEECNTKSTEEEKEQCREYNLREAEYYNKKAESMSYEEAIAAGWEMTADGFWIKEDKVNRWVLPIGLDELTGDCIVNLPDDLLEQVGWKEGDMVEWVDNKNGTFTLRKS